MVNETTAAATAAGTLQLQLAAGTYAAEFYNPSDGTCVPLVLLLGLMACARRRSSAARAVLR
jgi:hypothetical protein